MQDAWSRVLFDARAWRRSSLFSPGLLCLWAQSFFAFFGLASWQELSGWSLCTASYSPCICFLHLSGSDSTRIARLGPMFERQPLSLGRMQMQLKLRNWLGSFIESPCKSCKGPVEGRDTRLTELDFLKVKVFLNQKSRLLAIYLLPWFRLFSSKLWFSYTRSFERKTHAKTLFSLFFHFLASAYNIFVQWFVQNSIKDVLWGSSCFLCDPSRVAKIDPKSRKPFQNNSNPEILQIPMYPMCLSQVTMCFVCRKAFPAAEADLLLVILSFLERETPFRTCWCIFFLIWALFGCVFPESWQLPIWGWSNAWQQAPICSFGVFVCWHFFNVFPALWSAHFAKTSSKTAPNL